MLNFNLTYVTGNYGKFISVKEHFIEKGVNINFLKTDFIEPDINDITTISRFKVTEAFKLVKAPCFAADTGFYIDDYPNNPGYPGAFAKRSGISTDIKSLLEKMQKTTNRQCRFVDCLTFFDGQEFYTFYGISEGTLATTIRGSQTNKAKSNLWYVFIPKGCNKTLAEMSETERRERKDSHTSATAQFINWYIKEYMPSKDLNLTVRK